MKKFAALVAVLALVAFAAPAFAANPFMDVPMNHWAYDAVSQLASRGVVSGYPDGAFKGEWKATRYEMASVVARALAYVDMNKASKQDLELLKKLVVEFKDELDALGVKVDELDSRVALLEDRIGGWQFGGYFRVYMDFNDDDDQWSVNRFRWNIKKYVDDKVTLNVRLQGGGGDDLKIELAYLTIKLPWDTTATVGRFWNDWEDAFYAGDWWYFNMNDAYITDYRADTAVLFNKAFAMGDFSLYVAHEENKGGEEAFGPFWVDEDVPVFDSGGTDIIGYYMDEHFVGGELASDRYIYGARLNFNFNEMFSMAVNYIKYDYEDDTQVFMWENEYFRPYGFDGYTLNNTNVNNLFTLAADTETLWADIIVNFTPGITLKGQYFMQENDDTWAATNWLDGGPGEDSPNAWKAILTVDQDTLGFTSLWIEYAQIDGGFVFPNGNSPYGWKRSDSFVNDFAQVVDDTTIINVLAMQKWNDKWGTYVRYLDVDSDFIAYDNWTAAVTYWYTPNLAFELGYDTLGGDLDDDTVFLRTVVFF